MNRPMQSINQSLKLLENINDLESSANNRREISIAKVIVRRIVFKPKTLSPLAYEVMSKDPDLR